MESSLLILRGVAGLWGLAALELALRSVLVNLTVSCMVAALIVSRATVTLFFAGARGVALLLPALEVLGDGGCLDIGFLFKSIGSILITVLGCCLMGVVIVVVGVDCSVCGVLLVVALVVLSKLIFLVLVFELANLVLLVAATTLLYNMGCTLLDPSRDHSLAVCMH